MDKKNKGLADNQEGEFILNESGTSVSTDPVEPGASANTKTQEEEIKRYDDLLPDHKPKEDTEEMSSTDDV